MNDNTDYAEKLINDEIKKLTSYKHGLERMKAKAQEGKLEPSDACSEELLRIDADAEIEKLDSNIKSLELALDACDSVNCPVWCRDDLVNDVKVRVMSFVGSWGHAYDAATQYCSDIVKMVGIIPECHRVYRDNVTERYDIYVSIGSFNSLSEEIHKVPVPSDLCNNQEGRIFMRNSMLAGEHTLYFEWLINRVGGAEWWNDYTESLVRMFERSYYYENVIDSAAALRGKDLRTEAIVDGIPAIAVPNGEVTVLEVLISLAIRVNDELLPSEDGEDRSAKYFDDILEVLGMKVDVDYIDDAIDRFLSGKSQITRRRKLRPFEATLWQQTNMVFYDQFKIETDSV